MLKTDLIYFMATIIINGKGNVINQYFENNL